MVDVLEKHQGFSDRSSVVPEERLQFLQRKTEVIKDEKAEIKVREQFTKEQMVTY